MSAPAHFSSKISKEEERQVRELEARDKRGKPKLVYTSHIKLKCPDCGCVLKSPAAEPKKDWVTQCCWYHAWRVFYDGPSLLMERILTNDPRYPGRNKG